jgi:hypothetical protein
MGVGMADDHNALLARLDDLARQFGGHKTIEEAAAELRALTSRHQKLVEDYDRLHLAYIAASNPGIDMDQVRAVLDQAKDPDHE